MSEHCYPEQVGGVGSDQDCGVADRRAGDVGLGVLAGDGQHELVTPVPTAIAVQPSVLAMAVFPLPPPA